MYCHSFFYFFQIYNETSRNHTIEPMCRDCCRHSRADPVCSGKCGYESDGLICEEFCDKEQESFIKDGTGQSLVVHYHTRCGACAFKKQQVGFRMVFTAYRLLSGQKRANVFILGFFQNAQRSIPISTLVIYRQHHRSN